MAQRQSLCAPRRILCRPRQGGKDGNDFGSFQATGKTPVAEFNDTPPATGRTYYRVMVEGPATPYPQVPESMALNGNMVGLSNPIYFNFDPNF